MKSERRRITERIAIVSGLVGGFFLVVAFTLMLTTAPIVASAICLPVGLAGLVLGIGLALLLRRGVAADTWPRSGRNAPR
ncbi:MULTISPECIES: hypothetical protein [unclassified Frondihabitans]|uniref:hypothetical protein n=1 Tax=unclassified Frondihabitans TaxID=2626248 RepID=UPI0006FBFBD1|nr:MULTISPECIES: hypothetical protein [unclassified Frondihabitans]KQQ25801.1 hypothetical protein ASF54_15630 [Frondihabitans sp. Leaf304]MBF4574815.1 hypothetical protein [Frondihabitans sp. VKM Ac-2883]RPE77364.1 hypothetical protein EDF37_0008 [Frondihabitans sp. PhB153]RPF07640.1 hypothetical protein EDF39_0008 [Frondihabitans sp. PhB161]